MFVSFLVPCFLLLTDIDECVSGVHDCHRSASCANTVGSYTCTCNHPLAGDGKTCRYTAAGENFTLIVLQFRSQWLELSSNCPPNMMPKTDKKLTFRLHYFLLWNGLKKSNSPKLIHQWCISAVDEPIRILLSTFDQFAILQGLLLLQLKENTTQ